MIDLLLIRLKSKDNVGSIYRLAMQYGINKIYSYKSVSAGATDTMKTDRHIPIHPLDSLDYLREYDCIKFLLETGGMDIRELRKENFEHERILIAVANESHGATDEEKALFDEIFTIPAPNIGFHEKMISYNVSQALALGLYEITYGKGK